MKTLTYLGRAEGFGSRTYTEIWPTPFLPYSGGEKWRSPVSQRFIQEDLEEFCSLSNERPVSGTLDIAVHRVSEMFRLPQKQPMIHLNDVFSLELNIWNKSPGLPWVQHGYKTKGDIRNDPEAIRSIRKFAHFVKEGRRISPPDCLAYVRSHICDHGTTKVRAVWGYPATITFMEAMFAVPLIRAYEVLPNDSTPIAYGFETAVGGAKKAVRRFRRDGRYYVGLDFKKFDKRVPSWLIMIAFDILLQNIDLANYKDYGVADIRKSITLYYFLRDYFLNTKIRLPVSR